MQLLPEPTAPPNITWTIVTMKEPVMWARDIHETWLLNPPLRYVVHASHVPFLADHISSHSFLSTGSAYKPLMGEPLRGSKILVERHRERGVGDHLFMTGIYKFLNHVSGGSCQIYQYALHSRAPWLNGCPWLASEACLTGPLCYETFPVYDHHWMVEQVTEYTSETDQLNVYDALLKSIGADPYQVANQFKRPYCFLLPDDLKQLDTFFWRLHKSRQIDLRTTKYAIVSPLCNSMLRMIPYNVSLAVIQTLAKQMPVIILGDTPISDPAQSQFTAVIEQLSTMNKNIVNLLGAMPPRLTMALVSRATYLVTPDSGLLYVAQGFRVPAVSVWGPQSPFVRIGYDNQYMELAIHKTEACRNSPCFAYNGFPKDKCPRGAAQKACEPLSVVTEGDIMSKLAKI